MNSKFQLVAKKCVICVEKFYVYNIFIKKKNLNNILLLMKKILLINLS